jgi:hypothetical protein
MEGEVQESAVCREATMEISRPHGGWNLQVRAMSRRDIGKLEFSIVLPA